MVPGAFRDFLKMRLRYAQRADAHAHDRHYLVGLLDALTKALDSDEAQPGPPPVSDPHLLVHLSSEAALATRHLRVPDGRGGWRRLTPEEQRGSHLDRARRLRDAVVCIDVPIHDVWQAPPRPHDGEHDPLRCTERDLVAQCDLVTGLREFLQEPLRRLRTQLARQGWLLERIEASIDDVLPLEAHSAESSGATAPNASHRGRPDGDAGAGQPRRDTR